MGIHVTTGRAELFRQRWSPDFPTKFGYRKPYPVIFVAPRQESRPTRAGDATVNSEKTVVFRVDQARRWLSSAQQDSAGQNRTNWNTGLGNSWATAGPET
jgi:hypothetical protein